MELASSGQTPAELLRRLCGKSTLRVPEGGKLALDLKALHSAATKGGDALGAAALTKGQTSVEQFEVQTRIQDGVLVTETALARSGSSGLFASGEVDLAGRTMDLRLVAKANPPQDRPLLPADVTGGDTIALRGPWSAPSVEGLESDAQQK
jgi:hypothetical protein